jgi:hypothetical protein
MALTPTCVAFLTTASRTRPPNASYISTWNGNQSKFNAPVFGSGTRRAHSSNVALGVVLLLGRLLAPRVPWAAHLSHSATSRGSIGGICRRLPTYPPPSPAKTAASSS